MTYLVIEEMKKNPIKGVPEHFNKKYGLVDTETGKVLLPVEYSSIIVKKKGGFVWTERCNEDFSRTYEVYEILANGALERVPENDPTDFIWSIYGTDVKVLRVKGKIQVMRELNECID